MENTDKLEEFIQNNSPDGGLLQSEQWRNFQESVGCQTFNISSSKVECRFWANIMSHPLPIIGNYFYIPRGPVLDVENSQNCLVSIGEIINLAKKENASWIRFDANNQKILDIISSEFKTKKAPHDMQPKEIFVIDIAKSEEELLAAMKGKTRYNVRLAKKKGVNVFKVENGQGENAKYLDEFLRLVKITSGRQGIVSHNQDYYRKMLEIPDVKLYVAEYKNKIIATNLVSFYGDMATYLHGASDDNYRNVMAPFALQWKQIKDAKEKGCQSYDFGGVKLLNIRSDNNWQGITRFKLGFSPKTKPLVFQGSYDIVINAKKYYLYRILQKGKNIIR